MSITKEEWRIKKRGRNEERISLNNGGNIASTTKSIPGSQQDWHDVAMFKLTQPVHQQIYKASKRVAASQMATLMYK